MVVEADGSGASFRAGKPWPAISGDSIGGLDGVQAGNCFFPDFDVAPGGTFVLFAGDEQPEGVTTAKHLTGWFSELRWLTTETGR